MEQFLTPLVNMDFSKVTLDDAKPILKMMSVGGVAVICAKLLQIYSNSEKSKVAISLDLGEDAQSIMRDLDLAQKFQRLKQYEFLNPHLFHTAMVNAEKIMLTEYRLLMRQIMPRVYDSAVTFTSFRICLKRLNEMRVLAQEKELSTALLFDLFDLVNGIYKNLQQHLLNIIHLCQDIPTDELIATAQRELREERSRDQDKETSDREKRPSKRHKWANYRPRKEENQTMPR